MILPPEPSRKSVNVLRAVSNVVSAPANAGPAVQAKRNRTSRARAIASSARPTLFRTSCMVGFLLIKTRPNRAQKEAHQSFRSRTSGPRPCTSIRKPLRPIFFLKSVISGRFAPSRGAGRPSAKGGMATDRGHNAPQLRTEARHGRFAAADSGFVNHSTFNKAGSGATLAGGHACEQGQMGTRSDEDTSEI